MSNTVEYDSQDSIAIIGMAGRFPGAKNIDEFWQNLRDGVESISFFSDEELEASGIEPALLKDPQYVKAHGAIEEIELFDASFFGFNPREAEIMDPQHRLFLECAWQALESAGYDSEKYEGSISVFAGVGSATYAMVNLLSNRAVMQFVGPLQASIRNRTDHLSTQVSYKLNLKGPGVTVQTACSTSLVAVHLACQSLLNGECDISMAGGVSISVPQKSGYLYQEGGILSSDGHCRAFDADSEGTVPGSGVGIVVLKRLEDALADGDCIHAVIKGSAINNDGSLKVGYTAPSVDGQAEVIAEALAVAGVDPATITYIEAHGTGTTLGDPIEIEALTHAFRTGTDQKGYCAIGAVKSNVGHLDTAAGVAGLIKTVLALKHKQIPPSLHYKKPNPRIDFDSTPFYVNTELSEWKAIKAPRRAGVSSFGLGGTNAHIVLEEAPAVKESDKGRPWQLLLLSAKTSSALENATLQLADYIKDHPEVNLADVAYTLQVGRRAFEHRRAVVCQDEHVVTALETLDPKLVYTGVQEPKERPVVFMFTGQGAQYVNMGLDLYREEPTFRQQVDLCCDLLERHLGFDLREVLYPSAASEGEPKRDKAEEATDKLKQTYITQPALFVVEYALARLFMEWGVRPEAMIGHSIGEYVAACLAGVFTLEEALALVAARGRLMQSLPGGSMLVVQLPEKEVRALLNAQLSLAAVNGPSLCVVSGPTEAVDGLEEQLKDQGVGCRRLHTSHAFHSHMMEPILESFIEEVKKVELRPPQIPYVSNVTGTWITGEEATDPNYWAKHVRQTVRFAEGVHELVKEPDWVLLEVGPGKTLMTLARWHPQRAPGQNVLTSLPPANDDDRESNIKFLLTTLGRLWIAGVKVDWSGFYAHQRRRRVPLPTYPFERKRYWIEARSSDGFRGHLSLDKKQNVADWFYVPSWKRSALSVPLTSADLGDQKSTWLVFVDECGLGSQLMDRLTQLGHDVVPVRIGESFGQTENGGYTVHPRRREDYEALLKELRAKDKAPEKIVHLWNVSHESDPEKTLDFSFYSPLFLAQALGSDGMGDASNGSEQTLQIWIVTNDMQEVVGEELRYPEKATVIGPCRAISQEYAGMTCRSIDVTIPASDSWQDENLVDHLIAEFVTEPEPSQTVIAYRGNHRWVQDFEPVRLNGQKGRSPRLRDEGVYLITGGLGGIGLELAEYLARTVQAKLVLVGRSVFPDREAWDDWLATHENHDKVSAKIRKLLALEEIGSDVLVLSADVTDKDEMEKVVAKATERFGQIHGVIHAAGVAGGGMIQLKAPDMAASVLAPKVQGTRVLEAVLKDTKLDFFALCSSRAAILGGFGQVDYCAANAFLDAFAHYNNGKNGTFTVSINWAGWQEVGMRVDTLEKLGAKTNEPSAPRAGDSEPSSYEEIGHPLLARCVEKTPEREVYSTEFSVATHWVLDDHRIARQPIIPGTTYLEMVRAALERHAGNRGIELRDVYFLSALPVRDDETKEVRTVIEKNGEGFEFRVLSKMESAAGEIWQEYVIGKARIIDTEPAKRHDIQALIEKCNKKEVIITDDNPIVTYEDLGPRWLSLKQVYVGDNELVAILELPEAFAADVETYKLHPALLDRANFTAKVFLAFEGLHLPFGYRGLQIKQALPRKIYAYAKYKPNDDPLLETITFDVILMDEDGIELVVVDEFSQKRVREVAETMKSVSSQDARRRTGGQSLAGEQADDAGTGNGAQDQDHDNEAMTPKEGVEVFSRILSSNVSPQIVVSPQDLLAAIEHAHVIREARLTEDIEELDVSRPKHARPDVETPYVAPRNEIEQTIAEIWQDTLGIEQVGIQDNFFELGGDSVVGIQMIAKFKRMGLQLSPQQLFQNQTIAELAASLDTSQPVKTEQGPVTGPVPLVPSQRWFFELNPPEPHHFNQAMVFEVRQSLDFSLLQKAVEHLLAHHDALRLRFQQNESGWQQINAEPDEAVPLTKIELSGLSPAEQEAEIEAKAAEVQASLNLSQGPLTRFVLFDLGTETPDKFLIVIHYLAVDSVSWWILLSDLDTAYQQLARGETIQLPPKTSSFKQWAEGLTEYAQSDAVRQEVAYWLTESREQAVQLPVDFPEGANTEASTRIISVSLDVDETQALLHEAPQAYHTVVNDLLLTALVQTFAPWTGEHSLLLELEDHGRDAIFENMDLSRTVGSFRAVYPVLLDLGESEGPGEALKSIKEQLRRVPNGGIGYGLLRYLSGDEDIARKLRNLPQANVRFSYLGQFDQVLPETSPFAPDQGALGPLRSLRGSRSHLLEVKGIVNKGQLRVDWTYSENVHRRDTVEGLAHTFVQELRNLIAHCQSPDAGGYTPSDFPLANVDQQQLDRIAEKFKTVQMID